MWFDAITSSTSSINSSSSTESTSDSSTLDKDAFLKLLITELQNQNPLEPMDNQDFVNQMVQFQNMEQMSNMSESLQSFLGTLSSTTKLQASSVVGKYAVIEGNEMELSSGYTQQILYSMDSEGTVMITIEDENGTVVRTELLGYKEAGLQTYQWDGMNDYGATMEDGTYTYQLSTIDENGNQSEFGGVTGGIVQAVQYIDDDIYVIINGESYSFENIIEISEAETADTDSTEEA
jgi:flagellar basal-body rod modification protein FlgD